MSRDSNIDVDELEAKRQRVMAKSNNPTSKKYGDKLVLCPRNNLTVKPPSFSLWTEVDPGFHLVNLCKAI